jgi:hypothetical protein
VTGPAIISVMPASWKRAGDLRVPVEGNNPVNAHRRLRPLTRRAPSGDRGCG